MDEFLCEMGKRISTRRKGLGMTQEDLAEKAGLTSQTISTAETGTKALRPQNIVKLCKALETSADYLLFGEISSVDLGLLSGEISALSPEHYRYWENITKSYLAAIKVEKSLMEDDSFHQ
jgi:transcriptional regulator with XRE-family HTH domain